MPVAVVTGANSGIGHAFARLLIQEGYETHACDINIGDALQSLQCRLHRLDVSSPDEVEAFAQQFVDKPVDVLLNVAGTMIPVAQDTLANVTKEGIMRVIETNTVGPLLLTQALVPSLCLSGAARVGIMSSRTGSIGDNSSGGGYAYRASKAAVNIIGKSLAVDLRDKNVVVTLLHPGFVRTNINLGKPPNPASIEPEEAVAKLWTVFTSKGIADTGRFWHRDGFELPW